VLQTLDHVVIAVRDLDAATQTYSALLGRRPSWRGHHPRFGTANTLFRLTNTYLELLTPAGEGAVGEILTEQLQHDGEGLFALALGTDDADACAAALRERGIAASDPVEGQGRDEATGAERKETTVSGIDHVVVTTQDPDASRTLYADKLGIRLALDRAFEARGLRLLFFRIGGITLEFAARLETAQETAAPDRLWGIAYQVPEASATRERLAKAGFEVTEASPGHKDGTTVCTVRRETHGVATLLIGPA
jgi:catechol 2,3-dioxygenase-like lactoylglutathione lyase family enzyme